MRSETLAPAPIASQVLIVTGSLRGKGVSLLHTLEISEGTGAGRQKGIRQTLRGGDREGCRLWQSPRERKERHIETREQRLPYPQMKKA